VSDGLKRWHCQVCGLPLGLLDRATGAFYPMIGGWWQDRDGILHGACPRCKTERTWDWRQVPA
jgi:hypothetical protein